MVDDLRTRGVGNGSAVGGPNDAANAHAIVRDGRLRSVGEPPYDQVAPVLGPFTGRGVAPHERYALAVRRWDDIPPAIRLAPHRLRRTSRNGDLPQIAVMREIHLVAVFIPERALHL